MSKKKDKKVPFLDFQRHIRPLKSEILGEHVEQFEKDFASYCDSKFALGVSTGTDAIKLALAALGVGKGDEVIIPANTFVATAAAVSHVGATPVLVDVNPDTYLIDTTKIEEKITKNTKVIMPVHLYGQIADMDEILEIAKKHNLFVVEDSAQAHGATYKGKKAGSFGDVSCFSFYPGKNLGAFGEGGACVTNNESLYLVLKKLRDHGSDKKYYHDIIGYNDRMAGIQGAVLGIKLRELDKWNSNRKRVADKYKSLLGTSESLKISSTLENRTHVYHVYVVELDDRDSVRDELEKRNIGTNIHYPVPVHLQKAYAFLGYQEGDFPVSESAAKRILSLPMFAELEDEEIEYVCESLLEIMD